MDTKGQAAPEVEQAYARARELCQQVGETPQLFQVLRGCGTFTCTGGSYRRRVSSGSTSSPWPSVSETRLFSLEAHYALGNTLNYLGELLCCPDPFRAGDSSLRPPAAPTHAFRYGQDPGVVCRAYGAVTLWFLGYPDQALQRSHEALTLARELAHPFSLGTPCSLLPGSLISAGRDP